MIEQVEKCDRLAFKQKEAARLLDLSYPSIRKEILRRKIFPTKSLKLITKAELLRYLAEETELSRRSRRTVRSSKRLAQEARAAA